MERHLKRITVQTVPFLALVLAACDGHHGGPAAPAPGVPQISNLNATLQGACTIQGQTGTVLSETLNYRDSDGDERGGTLQTTGRFEPSGSANDVNFRLPSEATVTGTTEGTIEALACLRFGSQTAFNLSVALLDAAGHSSNILSVRLSKPAGAPEVPAGGSGGGAMEPLRP